MFINFSKFSHRTWAQIWSSYGTTVTFCWGKFFLAQNPMIWKVFDQIHNRNFFNIPPKLWSVHKVYTKPYPLKRAEHINLKVFAFYTCYEGLRIYLNKKKGLVFYTESCGRAQDPSIPPVPQWSVPSKNFHFWCQPICSKMKILLYFFSKITYIWLILHQYVYTIFNNRTQNLTSKSNLQKNFLKFCK